MADVQGARRVCADTNSTSTRFPAPACVRPYARSWSTMRSSSAWYAAGARKKLMKPGPAISTFATRSLGGSAANDLLRELARLASGRLRELQRNVGSESRHGPCRACARPAMRRSARARAILRAGRQARPATVFLSGISRRCRQRKGSGEGRQSREFRPRMRVARELTPHDELTPHELTLHMNRVSAPWAIKPGTRVRSSATSPITDT
jgi:hypothetical protein